VPYSSDLLAQAKHLATNEPKRPKQASLRRAVSAAYYALFHFLISEAALYMVKGAGHMEMRPVFQRAFVHSHMKRVAMKFANNELSARWKGAAGQQISQDLRDVARAFGQLQEARHEADYNLSRQFSRGNVNDLIEMSEKAMEAWRTIRDSAEAHAFLIALLVYESIPRS